MVAIFLLLFFFLFLFTIIFKRKNKNDELPRNWPLIGMLPTFVLNFRNCQIPDKFTEVISKSSKGTIQINCGVLFGNRKVLATCDPANVRHITGTSFWDYPKGHESAELFDTLGDSLFNLDSEEWTRFRRILHAYLTHKKTIRFMENLISMNIKEGLVPVLDHASKQDLVVDLEDLFKRHLYDFACKMCTGFNPKSLTVGFSDADNAFLKAMDIAFEAILSRHLTPGYLWRLQRWLGIGKERKLRAAQETMHDEIMKHVWMKRELLGKGGRVLEAAGGFDLLQCVLTNESGLFGSQHDDETIRDSLLAFIFGAQDTVSAALSWFFHLLSKNPLVEMKIREETVTNKDLAVALNQEGVVSKLVYLHAALCESLRLYPPAPFIMRTCNVESDILPSGHRVDKGTKVLLSAYATARMKSIWGEDCGEFKPERWINERGEIKHEPSNKFFAFSSGPRICPGKEMAFKILKAVAAAIIFNYRVQVLDSALVVPAERTVMHMKHPLLAKVRKQV